MFRKIRAKKPKVLSISTIADFLMVLNNSADLRSAFTSVLVGLDREHREGFPTMAVTIKNGRYRLIIGDLMEALALEAAHHGQLGVILVHELMHIVQTHIEQSLESWKEILDNAGPDMEAHKERWAKVNPLAVDYAVNSVCLETKLFTLHQFNHSAPLREDGYGELKGVLPTDMNLKMGLSYREYFHTLWEIMEDNPPADWPGMPETSGGGGVGEAKEYIDRMSGGGNPFQHIEDVLGTDDLEALEPEDLEDLIASASAASAALTREITSNLKSRGFGSSSLCEELEKSLEGPTLDWRSILSEFIQTAREASEDPISTNMKPSLAMLDLVKKSPYRLTAFPGTKKKPVFRVGVFIDTSGSVSREMLRVFLTEIDGIMESGVCALVIHCDSTISHVEEIEAGDTIRGDIYGRGGTDFNPPFSYVIEEGILLDAVLYFTDGEAPLPEEENRIDTPVLWVIPPGCRCPGTWTRASSEDQLKELEYGSLLIVTDN